jgi:hypothetical protein
MHLQIHRKCSALVVFCLALIVPMTTLGQGYFVGRVAVEWLTTQTTERDMRLLEPFGFVDPTGKRWQAPSGTVINGASIPQAGWSFVGSPYTGNYRRASVIHDYYCDTRTETWEHVHRMFYDAMLTGGVDPTNAKIMYGIVWGAGPRWETIKFKNLENIEEKVIIPQVVSVSPQFEREVQEWIRSTNPTLNEIERRVASGVSVK